MRVLAATAMVALFVLAVAFVIGLSPGAIAAPGDTVRVSESSAGVQGNLDSTADDITPTGRFVSFSSYATTLGQDPPNTFLAVYVRDRDTDTDGIFDEVGAVDTQLASVPENGPGASGDSFDSSISSDGRYVAFASNDFHMTVGDTNNASDIIVRDRVFGTTGRVSVSSAGAQANGNSSLPSISRDGRFVAFCSGASNLIAGDTNARDDVFLRDRDTDTDGIFDEPTDVSTVRVSEALGGGDANSDSCVGLQISGNGQFVTFGSTATNIVASDTNSADDVFVWDRLSGITERVSITSGGVPGNGASHRPATSNDGRYVAFRSVASNLVAGDTNGLFDIFLRDRTLGTTERVSMNSPNGQQASFGQTDVPTVSDDGRYVAFESSYPFVTPSTVSNFLDVYVRDRQTSTTFLASVDSSGTEACGGDSFGATISGNGVFAFFSSNATNLVAGDTNLRRDAFVHASGGSVGVLCASITPTPTPPSTPSPTPIPAGSGPGSVFTPTTGIKLCNGLPSTGFGDGSVSGSPACVDAVNDGLTITSTLPTGNVYFSSMVTFVPSGGTPSAGTAGSLAGGVRSAISVGSFNAPCNISANEDFVLYNVPLPDNTADPRASTNIVYPMAPGTSDRFSKWKVGSQPTGADPSGIDTGGDPNYAVGTSLAFNNYPSYLLDSFDPDFVPGVGDGANPPIIPDAVYGALTNFSGQWRPLFLVKLAHVTMPAYTAPFPAGTVAKPAMGSPLMWVQGDQTDTMPTPDTLTDTCSPAVTTMTLTGSTSMATGTNFYLQYLSSIRDTDQDGYENTIDTCPVNVNVGNPRTGTGDADADGIDDTCDPATPTPVTAADHDGDGFVNREDNCVLVANSSQAQSETGPAADKGPTTDNIGDPCDSESGTRGIVQNCNAGSYGGVGAYTVCTPGPTPFLTITPSDTVANGRYMTVTNVVAKCVSSTDADGDGYCLAQDKFSDSGACQATPTPAGGGAPTPEPPSCATRHNQWSGATHPALQMDTDGDKQSDALETYVGTDPVQSCSQITGNNNEPMDNWMFDLSDDRIVAGNDTGPFAAPTFGRNVVAGPFSLPLRPGVRFDFNSDGQISSQDTGKFGGVGPYTGGTGPFNKSCSTAGIPTFHQQ